MQEAPLLWLLAEDEEQCSEVYFFLGTRALKVAVFLLAAGLGLLLALGVLLLLQLLLLLPPLSLGRADLSSADAETVASDSASPSEPSRALAGSARDDSGCELEEKDEEGVWFGGDLLLSLFSSESLFSPPSDTSPTPRRFPPFARVEGGERRPCFFIGFIFSSGLTFPPNNSSYLFIPEILLGVPLLMFFFFFPLPPPLFLSLYFSSSAGAPLFHPVSSFVARLRHLPALSRRL